MNLCFVFNSSLRVQFMSMFFIFQFPYFLIHCKYRISFISVFDKIIYPFSHIHTLIVKIFNGH